MTAIPTTPKRFFIWLDKQHYELPYELYELGNIHYFCLHMIRLNQNNSDALRVAKRVNAVAMREFKAAYADWLAGR